MADDTFDETVALIREAIRRASKGGDGGGCDCQALDDEVAAVEAKHADGDIVVACQLATALEQRLMTIGAPVIYTVGRQIPVAIETMLDTAKQRRQDWGLAADAR